MLANDMQVYMSSSDYTDNADKAAINFKEPVKGTKARCPNCGISILLISKKPPAVCPFCHSRLQTEAFTPKPPTPLPENMGKTLPDAYKRPGHIAVLAISVVSIILLAIAVYFKLFNLKYYWYQPYVNLYSITVGAFILSRFLLAAFYIAPRNVGYKPGISVIVACMNEEDSIEKTIERIYSEGYPHSKLEVVVVNDGSTDNTFDEMLSAQSRHHSLVVVNFEQNKGKRHGMAIGALIAQGDILTYVDSDSFLSPGALHKIVQGFADPTVAAVSGHTDVENYRTNILTKMQHVRYYVSYRVMKGAEHVFGAVSCCPGCFSAYRKSAVLNVLDKWLHQRFLGKYATFGDDRSLTNYLLKHYRVLYDDQAIATTIVPDKWIKYFKQQARWKRSWIREMFFAGRFMWYKHPIAAISWYAMTILPLIAPLVMFNAMVRLPLVYGRPPSFYIGGVLVVSLLWALYFLQRTGRSYWWTAFLFTITYVLFFSWQGYYAALTLRKTEWGTR
jgi:hyaluronan synthase